MDFEKEISNVIEAILTQNAEKNAAAVSALKNSINQSPYNFHDPNVYDTVLMYPIRQMTGAVADNYLGFKDKTGKAAFIYLNYDFVESNISKLMQKRTGFSASVDKSRTVISTYLKYLSHPEEELPDFCKDHYWLPKFGSAKEWIEYCDSLINLYYGEPERYLETYRTLLKADIRKFKRTLYEWYLVLNTGEEFSIDYRIIDDEIRDPLKESSNWAGELFMVVARRIPESARSICKKLPENSIYSGIFIGIPKDKIKKTYFIKKEVFV